MAPGIGNSAASGDRAFVAFWQGARNVDYCGCRLVAKSEAGQALRAEQVEGDALVGLVVFRAVVVVERARIE